MKKGPTADALALLRVFAILMGAALALGGVAIALGKAGEFVRAQPVISLFILAVAAIVAMAVHRRRGATEEAEVVIDLTDEATAAAAASAPRVRASEPASRR